MAVVAQRATLALLLTARTAVTVPPPLAAPMHHPAGVGPAPTTPMAWRRSNKREQPHNVSTRPRCVCVQWLFSSFACRCCATRTHRTCWSSLTLQLMVRVAMVAAELVAILRIEDPQVVTVASKCWDHTLTQARTVWQAMHEERVWRPMIFVCAFSSE